MGEKEAVSNIHSHTRAEAADKMVEEQSEETVEITGPCDAREICFLWSHYQVHIDNTAALLFPLAMVKDWG